MNTTADTVDATAGDGACADARGACSLRAAVQEANAAPGADTIRLAPGQIYTLSLTGAGEDAAATGDLDVTTSIVLQGRGATVDAAGLDRAFDVLVSNLRVDGVIVVGGAPPETESGGAIVTTSGTLRVSNASLDANSATRAGGAIEANAGTTSLDRVRLTNNDTGPTPGNGGGLHLTGTGSVSVANSSVMGNTASEEGGGLWNSSTGTFTVTNTVVSGNTASGPAADQGGGGLFNDGGSLSVTDTTVSGNVADGTSGSGGGILNNLGTLSGERRLAERQQRCPGRRRHRGERRNHDRRRDHPVVEHDRREPGQRRRPAPHRRRLGHADRHHRCRQHRGGRGWRGLELGDRYDRGRQQLGDRQHRQRRGR